MPCHPLDLVVKLGSRDCMAHSYVSGGRFHDVCAKGNSMVDHTISFAPLHAHVPAAIVRLFRDAEWTPSS